MTASARWIDLAVIVAYLAGITWFGAQFRSSQRTLRDYFLGGKTAPWWAIALSIVSAETSTLTVIGTPPLAFGGNFAFLQLVLGYLMARLVIAIFFLPAYFRGEMFTAYELMRVRFGEHDLIVDWHCRNRPSVRPGSQDGIVGQRNILTKLIPAHGLQL